MKKLILSIAALCCVCGAYADAIKYTFNQADWVPERDFKETSITRDATNNNFSTSVTGNNAITLAFNSTAYSSYYITPAQKYLVVKGTNIGTPSDLYTLNGKFVYPGVSATYSTTASDGDVILVWDMTKSGRADNMNFAGTNNITLSNNFEFNLTNTSTTATIKDINFYTEDNEYVTAAINAVYKNQYETYKKALTTTPLVTTPYIYASAAAIATYNSYTYVASPTTKDEYISENNRIVAAKKVIESNALAEGIGCSKDMTYKINNASGLNNLAGWNPTFTNTPPVKYDYTAGFTSSTGKAYNDLACFVGGFDGKVWDITASQTVSGLLPATYLLSVMERSSNATGFALTANSTTLSLPNNGDDDTHKQYFERGITNCFTEVTPDDNNELKITIGESAPAAFSWVTFGHFKLVRISPVTFDETKALTLAADTAVVALTRTFKAGQWNTICLPFAVSADSLTKVLNANAVYELSTTNPTDNNIHLTKATAIEAGKPYLFNPTKVNANNKYMFYGVDVKADAAKTPNNSLASFVGTYSPSKVPAGAYFISDDNKIHKATADIAMNGFRGYFTINTTEGAKSYSIEVDGEGGTTGIQSTTTNASTAKGVYRLSGQRISNNASLNGLQKGLYIVNGKTRLVK